MHLPTRPLRDSLFTHLRKPIVHIIILSLLALLIYSNSFRVPFVFDDETSITDNPVIRSLSNFLPGGNGYDYHPRRVVGYFTLALNYYFGSLNVFGYHMVNLAVHIANALLVYSMVRLTFRTPFLNRSVLAPRSGFLALATALLFVAHPVQTQAVTYIVQRLTSLATLFYLAALVLHVRWRLAREAGEPFFSSKVLPAFLLSLTAALLAMKTKEIAFTLPFVVLMYELSFFGLPDLRRLASLALMLLTVAIIPLSMISIDKPLGELLSDVSKTTIVESALTRWEYLCTQFRVIVTYLRLLLLPIRQNLDYDYPVSHSLFDSQTILSLLLLMTLFAVAVILWRRSGRSSDSCTRLAAFGIFWFFITLMVESTVIPIADLIFEHRIYLPSIGFVTALVILITVGVEKLRSRFPAVVRVQAPLLIVTLLLLSGSTYARNIVWQDSISLWRDTVAKSPRKARPLNNLGTELLDETGRYEEAMKLFEQSHSIRPDADVHHNLGLAHAGKGNLEVAIKEYRESLRLNPNSSKTYSNLGIAFVGKGDIDAAIEHYQEALRLNPSNAEAYSNLGVALVGKNDTNEAIKKFQEALRLKPEYLDAHNNLGLALASKGELDAAINKFQESLRLDPDYANTHKYMAFVMDYKRKQCAAR